MIVAKRPGVIINILSVSHVGNMGQSNYSAAKAGVAAMTVTWAKELARHRGMASKMKAWQRVQEAMLGTKRDLKNDESE